MWQVSPLTGLAVCNVTGNCNHVILFDVAGYGIASPQLLAPCTQLFDATGIMTRFPEPIIPTFMHPIDGNPHVSVYDNYNTTVGGSDELHRPAISHYGRDEMINYLSAQTLQVCMDVKKEDTSKESRKNHIAYYASLDRTISDIQIEMEQETEPAIKEHLNGRIDAMEKDKKRIRDMFPDVTEEEWNAQTGQGK